MFLGELVEGDQPLPIVFQALDGLWRQLVVVLDELCPERLTRRLAFGIRHGTEERSGLGWVFGGDGIQDVREPMVPTALLSRARLLLGEGRPDAEVAVGNRTAPWFQGTGAQIAEYRPHDSCDSR
jgi:hypothetical protein